MCNSDHHLVLLQSVLLTWESYCTGGGDGEKQDETTVDTLHEDLSSITASVDGEEGSEVEEQGQAMVCHEDEEAVQKSRQGLEENHLRV